MKKHKMLTALGGILILLGLIGLSWGLQPVNGTQTMTIPSGDGYYVYWKVSGWMNGHLSGDFSVASGTVYFYVLDSAEFNEYGIDLTVSQSMASGNGASGTFSCDLPSPGTYYIVAHHGSGSASSAQDLTVNYKVSGIEMLFFFGGIVLLAVGAVIVVLAMRMKGKEVPEVGAAKPAPTDVTLFDNKPNPPG